MDDIQELTELNRQFIEAFRQGSWDMLSKILSPAFSYLDGMTGEVWSQEKYIENMDGKPLPTIGIDNVVVHVDGDTAVVSARSFIGPDPQRYNRYADTYERRPEGWRCVHATLWRV